MKKAEIVAQSILEEIKRSIADIQEEERRTGESYFYAPPKLQELAERYYTNNVINIYEGVKHPLTYRIKVKNEDLTLFPQEDEGETLTAEAVDEIAKEVTKTFAYNLFGVSDFNLSIKGIYTVLRYITPFKAYTLDKYAFYYPVMVRYLNIMHVYGQYSKLVKQETATVEDINTFLKETPLFSNSHAVWWLVSHNYIKLEELKGAEITDIGRFMDSHKEYKTLTDLIVYYFIAKYVLQATPEELREIVDLFKKTYVYNFEFDVFTAKIESEAFRLRAEVDITAEKYAEAFKIEQEEEEKRLKKREQAAKRAEKWEYEETTELPKQLMEILQKPINYTPEKLQIDYIPLQNKIDKYNRDNGTLEIGTVTPEKVQRVLESLSILKSVTNKVGDRHEYRGTINAYAEICGYKQPNNDVRLAVLNTLRLLHNTYIIVKKQELKCINVLTLEEIGLQSGQIIIRIDPAITQGVPYLMDAKLLNKVKKKTGRGALSASRFFYQICNPGKTNKAEDSLIDEVFGLSDKIRSLEIKLNDEIKKENKEKILQEIKKLKRYNTNHYGDFRKKIAGWFEEYQRDGLLEYSRKENKKGEYVYRWKIKRPLREEEEILKNIGAAETNIEGEIRENT